MRKPYRFFITIIPVLLFVLAYPFSFFKQAQHVRGVSLIELEEIAPGTIFSPIVTYLLFTLIGIALLDSASKVVTNLGKSFYTIGVVSSIMLMFFIMIEYGGGIIVDNVSFGVGAIFGFSSAVLGIAAIVIILIEPYIGWTIPEELEIELEEETKTEE